MKTVNVEVKEDHLATLSKTRKPIIAIAELIWNGLDADANHVSVQFSENGLGGLDSVRVLGSLKRNGRQRSSQGSPEGQAAWNAS